MATNYGLQLQFGLRLDLTNSGVEKLTQLVYIVIWSLFGTCTCVRKNKSINVNLNK